MKPLHLFLILITISTFGPPLQGATFLFDATKAEMAGNADWVIDADLHNLKVSDASYGSGVPNVGGNESNPQRFPTPPASGITSSTPETYWQGCLSAWAIDLVKNGHNVETLPYNGRITWNDGTNPQDLTNYQVYVLCEPNIYFTATEKAAIIHFVQNGGGLFIISDHSVADRNNDGSDAYQVLNDLMTNSVANNPFGISFNGDNLVGLSSNPDTAADDPIIFGPAGHVATFDYNNGSTITIHTNQNATARIAFWSSSTHATNNAYIAYATFGKGKVVAIGDSSPFDDGTGDPNDTSLFVDYPLKTVGDGTAILNASLWLAISSSVIQNTNDSGAGSLRQCILTSFAGDTLTFAAALSGQTINLTNGELLVKSNLTIDASSLPAGIVISGNSASRVFNITNTATVALNALTLANGRVAGTSFPAAFGAGILNQGSLTVNRCTLTGNWADQGGGAIYNNGLLTLNESTLAGNSAIYGGGILNAGTALVNQSTITANSATNDGGGIYLSTGTTMTLSNSIVAGNFGPTNANLHDTVSTGIYLTGINLTNGDPHLAPLENYGGPTPTMPPLPGSPALDACTNGSGFLTDQRGFPRAVDGDYNGSAVADIGAAEASWPKDTFGYIGLPAAFAFEDISTTGTRVLTNDDDTVYGAPIGFNFEFYGRSYSDASFTPNGLITMGGENYTGNNTSLSTSFTPGDNPTIAVLWDDWTTATPGADAVYYQTLGSPGNRRFIVQWNNVFSAFGSSNGVTFEATLYETNGTITYQYLDVDTGQSQSSGASATVGIQDKDGQLNGKNAQWSFNQPVISAKQAITFSTIPTDPSILVQPQDQIAAIGANGANGTFAVTATGSGTLTYQWQMNGYNLTDDGYNVSGANTATLTQSNYYSSGNTIDVVVSNAVGRVTSAFATFTVLQPVSINSQPLNQTNLVGCAVTFSVYASGDEVAYQWFANSNGLPGATGYSLTVTNLQLTNSGTSYTVVVSNLVSCVTSSPALLMVRDPETFMVTSPADDGGAGSFRQVLAETAEGGVVHDTITFATNLSVILLTNGGLTLDRSIAIDASALPNGIQINGNTNGSVFQVSYGETVEMDSLIITNGGLPLNLYAGGGGIQNVGTLTMNRCIIAGNSAPYGGGIMSQGTLTLVGCVFYNNLAAGDGGALFSQQILYATNCTFTANTAEVGGGCFLDYVTAYLDQVTISGNVMINNGSGYGGGGLTLLYSANVTLANSIVAGNSGSFGADIDLYDGNLILQGSNVIQDLYNDIYYPGTVSGPAAISANPLLAPLGNYGGPTQTMPPQFGSPAIDAAQAADIATDQRGYPRPSGGGVDLGAVEAQFAPTNQPPVLGSAVLSPLDQTFQFTFSNVPHADFSVLTSTNLALPLSNWLLLGGTMEIAPGQYQFIQNAATNWAQFYRVVSP